jgi:hypothetical protein
MPTTENADQGDLGFPKIIPPERSLVVRPRRTGSPARPGASVVPVEGATVQVAEPIVVPPATSPHTSHVEIAVLAVGGAVEFCAWDRVRGFALLRFTGSAYRLVAPRGVWAIVAAVSVAGAVTFDAWGPGVQSLFQRLTRPTVVVAPHQAATDPAIYVPMQSTIDEVVIPPTLAPMPIVQRRVRQTPEPSWIDRLLQ